VGSIRYFETVGGSIDDALTQKLDALQDAGKTMVLALYRLFQARKK
jgi:hypothetical protein